MSSTAPVWQVFTSCWFVFCSLRQTANLVRFYAINRGKVYMFEFLTHELDACWSCCVTCMYDVRSNEDRLEPMTAR